MQPTLKVKYLTENGKVENLLLTPMMIWHNPKTGKWMLYAVNVITKESFDYELSKLDFGTPESIGMNKEYEMVKTFQKTFGHPYADFPTVMSKDRAWIRYGFMKEEIDEFLEASVEGDVIEQADAMIDLMYFALGTLVEIGVQPAQLFEIVQNANMSKLWADGKPRYDERTGKILKPEGWVDPHEALKEEVERQLNEYSREQVDSLLEVNND